MTLSGKRWVSGLHFHQRRSLFIASVCGAATVILEDYESAVRRGAPILAEVLGYGFSSNGDHISSPNVDGPMHYSPAGNKKGLPCGKPLYKMCMI